jgi:hypothetical protein
MKVKQYEVRYGEIITECINNGRYCRKVLKNVVTFKKNELEKAKEFAKQHNSKVEIVWTI